MLITNGAQSSIPTNDKVWLASCSTEGLRIRAETMTDVMRHCMTQPLRPYRAAG